MAHNNLIDKVTLSSLLCAPGPIGNQPEKCLQCCQQSFDNLGGDYIDLYLIHWPGTQGLKPENEAQVQNRQNSWRIMEKLHKEGRENKYLFVRSMCLFLMAQNKAI